jgi:HK97 family phage prohead protease
VEINLELKSIAEDGSFEGLAAVYGNKDLGGDIIEPGAFTKSLAEKAQVPLLYQHDPHEPIGVGTLTDTEQGLAITGKLVLQSDVARKCYALMRAGALKGLSIGYQIVTAAAANGARLLKELKLAEVSIVTFPMNPLAVVTEVKEQDCAARQLLNYL